MRKLLKQCCGIIYLLIIHQASVYAQKEFFRSSQEFTTEQLQSSYSSLSIYDSVVLFNANDYCLYAYNQKDGSFKWKYKNNYKTNVPMFVHNKIVYAPTYNNKLEQTSQISLVDGSLIKNLPFGPLETKPFVKDNIFYGTAIYSGGSLIAYDLAKDTVIWDRFIAHGMSTQPYYFADKIIANAESNNWFTIGYGSQLLDTTCAVKANMFVESIPCIKKFEILSHDGKEITTERLNKLFDSDNVFPVENLTSSKFTYLLYEDKLCILKSKLKEKQQLDIPKLTKLEGGAEGKLIKADDENVWILYSDFLWQYNHKTQKTIQLIDLSNWAPSTVIVEGEKIWLISRKDKLLYGLSLMVEP